MVNCYGNIFNLRGDANYDGIITISDVLYNIWQAFLIPSKAGVILLHEFTGSFFELTCFSFESTGGVVASSVFWLLIFLGILKELNRETPLPRD